MNHRIVRAGGATCMGLGALVGIPAAGTLVAGVVREFTTSVTEQVPSWVYRTRESAQAGTFTAAGMVVLGRALYCLGRPRSYNTA